MLKEYICKHCHKTFKRDNCGNNPTFCSFICYQDFCKSKEKRDLKKYNTEYYKNNKDKMKEVTSSYYSKYPEKLKYRRLKEDCSRYDITVDDYVNAYNIQDGRCAICKKNESELSKKLHIDHDHKTGKFRGLLCHYCNTALGLLKEDVNLFDKSIEYLKTK